MNCLEIQALASAHTEGDTVDDVKALLFINECMQMDIGIDAAIIDSETLTVMADVWTALPSDLLEIFEVELSGQTEPYYGSRYGSSYRGDFDIRKGFIRFPIAGTFTIWHYVLPPAVASLGTTEEPVTPAVPEVFHLPMSLYVASRYKSYDDEENKDAIRLMQEYNYFKEKAVKAVLKTNSTTKAAKRIKTGAWR